MVHLSVLLMFAVQESCGQVQYLLFRPVYRDKMCLALIGWSLWVVFAYSYPFECAYGLMNYVLAGSRLLLRAIKSYNENTVFGSERCVGYYIWN